MTLPCPYADQFVQDYRVVNEGAAISCIHGVPTHGGMPLGSTPCRVRSSDVEPDGEPRRDFPHQRRRVGGKEAVERVKGIEPSS